MSHLKVEGKPGLVRDVNTLAILNTDQTEYETYIRRRDAALVHQENLKQQTQDINRLKEDFQELRGLLVNLINTINK